MERETNNQQAGIEVSTSLMNFFDRGTLYTLLWLINTFVATGSQAGYQGLEWHPLRPLHPAGVQVRLGLIGPQVKEYIKSAHQTWNAGFLSAFKSRNINALASWVLLPPMARSLDDIEKLQSLLGRKLPVVVYPEPYEKKPQRDVFKQTIFQPTHHEMVSWERETIEELTEEMKRRAYGGFCLDTTHFRVDQTRGIDGLPWQETLEKLLPNTYEIQISAGRIDMPGDPEYTLKELEDLLNNTRTTELPSILQAIRDFGWRGLIVTEIPAAALRILRNTKRLRVPDLIEDHKQIVGTIADLVS